MEKNQKTVEEKVNVEPEVQAVVNKKPFYKKKRFWGGLILTSLAAIGGVFAYKKYTAGKNVDEVTETSHQDARRDDRGSRDFRRHGERNNSNN